MITLLLLVVVVTLFCGFSTARDANVLSTEVFEVVIDPSMFNWTYEGISDQYDYEASLLNAPDLPSWIHFVFSEQHHSGILYGVPPSENKAVITPLEVIALNKKNFETRVERLNIIVSSKLNPARYEVHLKIDNLNVEDMFVVNKMNALKDIFRKHLWKDSEEDLYVTFLNSAIEMGARKPLNPNQGEGVIVRLGSEVPFSNELLELQEEIKPLRILPFCPRDYRRTSVEIYFRHAGFTLDWCSFKLIQTGDNNSAMHHAGVSSDNNMIHDHDYASDIYAEKWQALSRDEIPMRSYTKELLVTVTIPIFIMVLLVLILTFLLCFHHDDLKDETSEDFFYNLFHICVDYYRNKKQQRNATGIDLTEDPHQSQSQNFFSTTSKSADTECILNNREQLTVSPDPILLSRSHTDSPTSTIGRGVHCRPSPPPYVRPKFKPDF